MAPESKTLKPYTTTEYKIARFFGWMLCPTWITLMVTGIVLSSWRLFGAGVLTLLIQQSIAKYEESLRKDLESTILADEVRRLEHDLSRGQR